jgi:hypothetical protein
VCSRQVLQPGWILKTCGEHVAHRVSLSRRLYAGVVSAESHQCWLAPRWRRLEGTDTHYHIVLENAMTLKLSKGKRCALLWLIVGLLVTTCRYALGTTTLSAAQASDEPLHLPGSLTLLQNAADGVELEWTAPEIELRQRLDGLTELTAPGLDQTSEPGVSRLPYDSRLLAVPPQAEPRLEYSVVEEDFIRMPAPVVAASRPEGLVRDGDGGVVGGDFSSASAPVQPGPRDHAVLDEVGTIRGVRLVRVALYPALPVEGGLRIARKLRVSVHWDANEAIRTTSTKTADELNPILAGVARQVVNGIPAVRLSLASTTLTVGPSTTEGPSAYIEIQAEGVYRVNHADLAGLGFDGVDPTRLQLYQGSSEVALEWEGDTDSVFEADESFLFYAEPRFSRWTDVDAYRLTVGDAPGLRMSSRDADPSHLSGGAPLVSQVVEQNLEYMPDCLCGSLPAGRDGDRWAWAVLRRPDEASFTTAFETAAVDVSQDAELSVWLVGYTDVAASPDHRVRVSLNGAVLGEVVWDGKSAITSRFTIPAGVLRTGTNSLALVLPGLSGVSTEGAWLDGFRVLYGRSSDEYGSSVRFGIGEAEAPIEGSLDSPASLSHKSYLPLAVRDVVFYPQQAYSVALEDAGPYRAYDVSVRTRPKRLVNLAVNGHQISVGDPPDARQHSYMVASEEGILDPTRIRSAIASEMDGPADWIAIAYPDFQDALQPLVSLRSSQGLQTAVVDVRAIYDDPAFGDGRPDPAAIRAFLKHAYETWNPAPTYVLLVGDGSFDPRQYRPTSGQTFIPPYLADVDPWAGETAADNLYACVDGDDNLADIILGRLPVKTVQETQAAVAKAVDYEAAPSGTWNLGAVLVADDADSAGDFPDSSEEYAASYVTSPYYSVRHYCEGASATKSDCSSSESSAIKSGLAGSWNSGSLVMEYTGHSSWQQWAVERFFHLDDVAGLTNGDQMPVVIEMTCFTGSFHRPEPTLDESLVVRSGGGAVAAWGSSGLGVGTGHRHLSTGFFDAVYAEEVQTVGEAVMSGKLTLANAGYYLDLLDTIGLLGDPAVTWKR